MLKKWNFTIFDLPANVTELGDLVNPQVLAPIVGYELKNAMRFAPIAQVDNTLVGQPGNTISFPAFNYIGDAEDVAEGEAIPYEKLTTSMKQATVKKAGKGVVITDEASLSGYGDSVGEATRQIGLAIANKIDNDLLDELKKAIQTKSIDPSVDGLQEALDIYNDEEAEAYVLFVSPKTAAALRADAHEQKIGSDVGANQLIAGTYADILGVQIVRTRKLEDDEGLLVKVVDGSSPAVKLVMKRDVQVESERDIDHKAFKVNGDEHYTAYLYDPTKVVKVTFTP